MVIDTTVKIQILKQELLAWNNTMYQLSVRYRVFEKAGIKAEQLSEVLAEMEQTQKVLDGYENELKSLQG